MNEFEIESLKLKDINERFLEVVEYLNKRVKTIINELNPDRQELYDLLELYHNRHRVTKESLNKPYFARIDFKDKGKSEQCYISKVGVTDEDYNIITVDWRSPIASLYYDSNVGECFYVVEENVIHGEMTLKRQYHIENGKLLEFHDVDIVTSDEILNPYLGKTADNRLKNIVSSIQQEQNKIIRHSLYEHTIVQGVAGSGKTTVALHRIAYLVYNYNEQINRNEFLVIGPNNFFLEYISNVLPDLDVTAVRHVTFQTLLERMLEDKIKRNDKQPLIEDFETKLNSYFLTFQEYIEQNDFYILKTKIISGTKMKRLMDEMPNMAFEIKLEHLIKNLTTRIKAKQAIILNLLEQELNDEFANQNITKEQYMKMYANLKKELSAGASTYLKKHFSPLKKKITTIYNDFLKQNNSKRNGYTEQDLNGLLFLVIKIKGNTNYRKIKHAVIDEAQDYDYLRFQLLKELMPNCYFSIFGDLAQSISEYPTINHWNDIKPLYHNVNEDYLLKSYRTTVEIMNEANVILLELNMSQSKPVLRHGMEPLKLETIDVMKQIEDWKKKGYQSIALIVKEDSTAKKLSDKYHLTYINSESKSSEETTYVMSVATSKGLEFDAVIVSDYFEYQTTTEKKQLYVAITRALHELVIINYCK